MSTEHDYRLPDLGEGLTDAELISWRVAAGDRVALNEIVAEVETAKAVVELPSPFDGIVGALHAEEGSTIPVGAPLLTVIVPTSTAESTRDESTSSPHEGMLVGYGAPQDRPNRRRPRRATSRAAPISRESEAPASARASGEAPHKSEAGPRSTPVVRRLAREAGLDIGAITGTGPRGRVVRSDVIAATEEQQRARHEESRDHRPGAGAAEESRIPITGVRRRTAQAMVESAFTAPHVTEFLTVDVTESTELIARIRADGTQVNMLAVLAKALLIAIEANPTLNSRWDADSDEIVHFQSVHLGIATATDRGLLVPVIKNAQQLRLPALAERIRELATTAREGKTRPDDMSGGTITITNIGVLGIDSGTPIVNPGEAAILGMGAVRRQPWNHRGEIALRDLLTLSLSFDHRLVDGADGARFLTNIGALLSDPALSLLR